MISIVIIFAESNFHSVDSESIYRDMFHIFEFIRWFQTGAYETGWFRTAGLIEKQTSSPKSKGETETQSPNQPKQTQTQAKPSQPQRMGISGQTPRLGCGTYVETPSEKAEEGSLKKKFKRFKHFDANMIKTQPKILFFPISSKS